MGVHVGGNVEVDQAVVVEVGRDDAKSMAVASWIGYSLLLLDVHGCLGFGLRVDLLFLSDDGLLLHSDHLVVDVGEGQIAVVPVEQVLDRLDCPRRGVEEDSFFLVAYCDVVFRKAPAAVVGHIDVQVAVIVVVQHGATGGPVGCIDSGRVADVLECPVAVVQVKHVGPVIAQKHILIAVVVNISHDDAVAVSPETQTGSVGHVAELEVAEVLVKAVWTLDRGTQRQQSGRGEVNVHQAVVIEVEDRHARPVGRGEVFLLGHAREVDEVDAGFLGDLGKAERA